MSLRIRKKSAVASAIEALQISAVIVFLASVHGCGTEPNDVTAGRTVPKPNGAQALSRHYVEVAFPSIIDSTAVQPDDYAIMTSASSQLPIEAAFLSDDGTHVVLTTGAQTEGEVYTLLFGPGIAETVGQPGFVESGSANDRITFAGSTGSEPALSSAVALSNTTVLLLFDTKVELSTSQNVPYYRIADPDLNILSALRGAAPINDNSVVLTTSPQTDILYNVRVTNVRHSALTLYIDPTRNTSSFFGINRTDTTRPRLLQAVASGYEDVVLSFTEPLENYANDVANYSIMPPLAVLGAVSNEWGTQVTLKILPLTAGTVYTASVINVEDRSGNIIDPAFRTAMFSIPADEAIAPQVVSAVAIDCQTVLVTFSEPVSDNAGDPANYSVDPSLVIVGAQLSDFKTQVLLSTLAQTAGTEYMLTVSNITDSVGNALDAQFDTATFECEAGSNTANLGTLPRVVGATSLSNTMVLVGYDRPMSDDAADASRYFIVQTNVNGEVGTLVIMAAEFPDPSDKSIVRLTTTSQNEVTYQVTAIGVRDEQGNPLAPKIGFNGLILQDPTSAVFPGTPPGADDLHDADEDGINDQEELRGRIVTIELVGGNTTEKQVTSSPFLEDSDQDGLTDGVERAINTNPRDPDTDGDALLDEREYNLFYSNPTSQDSDNDDIDEGLEVNFFKTAPLLADTDGDGFSDSQELFELSRNPNVADLPRPNIRADNIRLQINEKYTFKDTEGNTATQTSSSQATLTQSTETKFSTSDTDVFKVGASVAVEISAKPKVTIGASFGAEFTSQTTAESARTAQQQYQNSVTRSREISTAREVTREIAGASVSATVTIVNEGDIAFTIGNIEVSVLQLGGTSRSSFLPVASVVPSSENNTFNLGPLITERGPFIFNNTDVFPNLVEDLMRSPRGLILKVANFDMTDEFGRNFAFTSQEVNDRTAEIRIDFGDGRRQSFRVATYGGLDDAGFGGPAGEFVGGFIEDTGETAGIPLDYALQAILKYMKNAADADSIVAGEDGTADTVAGGDDVQVVPVGTGGVDDRQVIVSAGEDGVLDTAPVDDDMTAKTTGYDTSPSCNEFTTERIVEPFALGNGIADTLAVGDDMQAIPVGMPAGPGAVVVSAGANGYLDTVQAGDEERRGAGDPCEADADCPDGACNAREVLTRFENSITGDRNRFWLALTSDELPVGTDFGQINLQPGFVILLAFIQDIDRDGLPAQEEYVHGSSDRKKDTDDDGIFDFAEVRLGWIVEVVNPYLAFSDPRLADSDGDTKNDPAEMMAMTDPRLADTDVDGINDNFEIDNQTGDPRPGKSLAALCPIPGSNEVAMLNPLRRDSDNDGLDDGSEVELGTCPLDDDSGPEFLDTDEDGLTNADEVIARTISFVGCNGSTQMVFNVTSDPGNGDTDFDGLPDLLETGSAALGIMGLGSNPRDVDTDNDGLLDFDEFADFSLFQHLNLEFPGFFLVEGDSQRIGTDLSDCDSDNDGLTDTFEREGGWTVLATGDSTARTVMSSPLSADTDADGLGDGQEFARRTDPTDPDTDGDGRRDGDEVASGSNPLDPDISVRVIYRRIGFPDGPECSGSAAAGTEWEWSLRVRRPVDGTGDGLLVDLHTCTAGIQCHTYYDLDRNSGSFVLRPGDTFSLTGIILDRDFCCSFSYVPEDILFWGPSNTQFFCPGVQDPDPCCTGAAVSCVGPFNRTFSFEDLVGGPDHILGVLMLGAETFINVEGGDENGKCKADVHFEIIVE